MTSDEAQRRLAQHGPNELREAPQPSFWSRLLDQFSDFLVMILIVAGLISLALGDLVEAAAIMAIGILNAILGVVQEARAEQSLAALKKMAAPEARVLRDGRQVTLPARELVQGDIVLLETGNYVPADVRLLEAVNLKIEEASLTGEPVFSCHRCGADQDTLPAAAGARVGSAGSLNTVGPATSRTYLAIDSSAAGRLAS